MIRAVVLITEPRHGLRRTAEVIRGAALALGPDRLVVQLRDKAASPAALLDVARALRGVTRDVRAQLIINGSPSVARAVGADGVHLPSEAGAAPATLASRIAAAREWLGREAVVTTAAHDDAEVRAALEAGATAALVSPIFASPGKGPARGVAALASARAIVDASRRSPRLLVYALGGVTRARAPDCANAGADGVAVIRALYHPAEPAGVEPAGASKVGAVALGLAAAFAPQGTSAVAARRGGC